MTTWTNSDGLVVTFGPRKSESVKAGVTGVDGREGETIVQFDYLSAIANIDGAVGDGSFGVIPAGAVIKDVQLKVTTAWSNTTNFTGLEIGTVQADDTEIDKDGFFDEGAAGAKANLTSVGTVVGETTEIGTVLSNSVDAYIWINTIGSADPTAGAATLIVRWVK